MDEGEIGDRQNARGTIVVKGHPQSHLRFHWRRGGRPLCTISSASSPSAVASGVAVAARTLAVAPCSLSDDAAAAVDDHVRDRGVGTKTGKVHVTWKVNKGGEGPSD